MKAPEKHKNDCPAHKGWPVCDCENFRMSANTTLDPIKKVYEKFKHLDKVLSDDFGSDDPILLTRIELWQAIKQTLGVAKIQERGKG